MLRKRGLIAILFTFILLIINFVKAESLIGDLPIWLYDFTHSIVWNAIIIFLIVALVSGYVFGFLIFRHNRRVGIILTILIAVGATAAVILKYGAVLPLLGTWALVFVAAIIVVFLLFLVRKMGRGFLIVTIVFIVGFILYSIFVSSADKRVLGIIHTIITFIGWVAIVTFLIWLLVWFLRRIFRGGHQFYSIPKGPKLPRDGGGGGSGGGGQQQAQQRVRTARDLQNMYNNYKFKLNNMPRTAAGNSYRRHAIQLMKGVRDRLNSMGGGVPGGQSPENIEANLRSRGLI